MQTKKDDDADGIMGTLILHGKATENFFRPDGILIKKTLKPMKKWLPHALYTVWQYETTVEKSKTDLGKRELT